MSLNPPGGILAAFETIHANTFVIARDWGAGVIACKSRRIEEWGLFRIYIIDEQPPLKHGCHIVIQSSGSPRDNVAPKYWNAPNSDWIWANTDNSQVISARFVIHRLDHSGNTRPEITNGTWIQLEKPGAGWVAADFHGAEQGQLSVGHTKDNGFARLLLKLY